MVARDRTRGQDQQDRRPRRRSNQPRVDPMERPVNPPIRTSVPKAKPRQPAAFRKRLGDPPTRGQDQARAYLARIERLQEEGHWSKADRVTLCQLRKRWQARAYGRDRRYTLFGVRPGRLGPEEQRQLDDADCTSNADCQILSDIRRIVEEKSK